VREIRTLHAMWRGLESDLRLGYRGTPSGNGRNTLGLAFGIPRQSSTLPTSPKLVICLSAHPARRPIPVGSLTIVLPVVLLRGFGSNSRLGCRRKNGF
jgi:hypothetical protein